MAKALKTVGIIAGAVALVATGVGAFAVGAAAATAATVGQIATVVAGVANIGSQALQKPPPARGSVQQMIVAANAPQPYVMGSGYFAGVRRYIVGYGGTVDGIENPYLFDVIDYGGGGPYQSITPQIDYASDLSWYSGFLYTDTQLGACPEADALAAHWPTPPGWGADYKLSGQAAIAWSLKFDKAGKKFTAGWPMTGALIEGAKVYDPRLDDTFPGGSGACRLGDETTYVYSDNPALHAGTYAYGRFQGASGDIRTLGVGLPADAIDWAVLAAWANVCDANGWTLFGVAFEGVGAGQTEARWQTLRDICAAGGADPVPAHVLSFRYRAPAVALATITEADAVDESDSVVAMQSYRDRINIVIPKYTSADHNWEQVQADPVNSATYVTEDGEERPVEWPFNFVKDVHQATQLAAYMLADARELHPIELTLGPQWRTMRPGECYHVTRPDLGLDTDAIVLTRGIDPATGKVKVTLVGETPAKHAFALGLTGTAPATPSLGATPEDRDTVAAGGTAPTEAEVTAPVTGTIQASAAIAAGDLVNIHTVTGAARMRKADASDPARPAHGFAPSAVASGASGAVRFAGLNPVTTALIGEVFLDDAVPGGFTATPLDASDPANAGKLIQPVGMAVPGIGLFFTLQPANQI